MLEKVKLALRIKTAVYDSELTDIVEAAKADLVLSGVHESYTATPDQLITRAIILYAKSHYGIDNLESEKYQKAYDSLKTHLCLSTEYTEVVI